MANLAFNFHAFNFPKDIFGKSSLFVSHELLDIISFRAHPLSDWTKLNFRAVLQHVRSEIHVHCTVADQLNNVHTRYTLVDYITDGKTQIPQMPGMITVSTGDALTAVTCTTHTHMHQNAYTTHTFT